MGMRSSPVAESSVASRHLRIISAKWILGCVIALAALTSAPLLAASHMMTRLESGEVITSQMGSAFSTQALVRQDPTKVKAILTENLEKLPEVFKNIAYARTYKTASGKNLVYLK